MSIKTMILLLPATAFMQCAFSQKIEHFKELCSCKGVTDSSLDTWQNIIDSCCARCPRLAPPFYCLRRSIFSTTNNLNAKKEERRVFAEYNQKSVFQCFCGKEKPQRH